MVDFNVNVKSYMRIAVVDKDKCKPDRCNHECKNFCPPEKNDIAVINIDKKAVIDESTCIGCGICVKKCPFDAIQIINLSHEVGKLVHQYGENEFRLFNLPIPKRGSVVGLLGRNGIGKSTAMQILSGLIKPNLGKYQEDVSWGEIISYFRGSELQSYLEMLSNKQISASYKIQRVESIAKAYGSKLVKELLANANKELIDKYALGHLMDRRVEQLSGGELQRLAIVAALSKNADFYFIDEPSSYLDIKQRFNVAMNIKDFASDKNMIVVEHDLVMLDYLIDFVHILYGTPGAYGVVSNIYASRRGINQYIEGYIKEENVRFRDYAVEFTYLKEQKQSLPLLFRYEDFEVAYDSGFKLEVEGAEIYQKEVIGILGENGIGKSTFIKVLAGIEKANKDLGLNLNISYKPQHIAIDYDGSVEGYFYENFDLSEDHKKHIILPLEIDRFMHKSLNRLSGGELQRVAIASALMKEADLYLLDEPSAYLDVEERLRLSKIIRSYAEQMNATVFVVEHDLLLLSSISDRVMLFDGVPGKHGRAHKPSDFKSSINMFLKNVGITMRMDEETKRPRINLPGSQKDVELKSKGTYFEIIS